MTESTLSCPRIDGARLWACLMALAEIGATAGGGVKRLALDDDDRRARDLFVRWCGDAGCAVRIDAVGNIFARRPGRDDGRPVVMTGSHLDTQPNGGRFDGAYGVMAGLEVLRTLNDAGIDTAAPLELVVWCNEEGTRFAPAMMGSMRSRYWPAVTAPAGAMATSWRASATSAKVWAATSSRPISKPTSNKARCSRHAARPSVR